MKCLIVDDNPIARTTLAQLCTQVKDLTISATCSSAIEACNYLQNDDVDILLLDIEMPEMSGLDLTKYLDDKDLVIIFTTSKREYAVDAFDLNVADFIVKPVTLPRFIQAIDKARAIIDSRKEEFNAMIKKYYQLLLLVISFSLLTTQSGFAQTKMLTKGDAAPVFTAKASLAGSEFSFSLKKALAKGPVVVYFYPSAYTGGCDAEAHEFAEQKEKFTAAGTTIIGVSGDDIQRLNKFSSDPSYCAGKFAVASDEGGKIAQTYGLVMSPPKIGMKDVQGLEVNHGFIPRTTYVIGKNGKIIAVFSSVTDHISPTDHVGKSLAIVKGL